MSVHTVKISNISVKATLRDLKEFFSFSGDIEYVDLQSADEASQVAYITFKDSQGAETAHLLTGATIIDQNVDISFAENYQLPPSAIVLASTPASVLPRDDNAASSAALAVKKAEDAVSAMLAKGFILGKDAINKAKAFDEKHRLMATATEKVSSLDKKIGLSEKMSAGALTVTEKVKQADEKFHVSEKTKSAYGSAKDKVSNAGPALFGNRYISASMAWFSSAFSKIRGTAGEETIPAVETVKEEHQQKREVEDGLAKLHLSDTPPLQNTTPKPKEQSKNLDDELSEVHLSETPASKVTLPSSDETSTARGSIV